MENDVMTAADFIDQMSEGMIAIDQKGLITTYNSKAKDMIGARRNCLHAHDAGRLEKGDIVILAFTSFGSDRGGIDKEDLKKFGIDLLHIEKGTTLLAAGQYLTGVEGKIMIKDPVNKMDEIIMKDTYHGISFTSKVNYIERYVEINVAGNNYRYYYNSYFNHFVIIDYKTKVVKFYQLGGYTLWKDDLKDLINHGVFKKKVKGYDELNVVGVHVLTLHDKNEIMRDFITCAGGEHEGYKNRNGLINGINIISTLKPIVRSGRTIGAYLLINDITRLQIAESQRNLAYKKLEIAKAALDDAKKIETHFSKIIGSSKKIMDVKNLAYKASRFRSNVLLLGESGTGKSLLARAIHEASEVDNLPFIEVNCNSIPESLIESELFGYEKGAFTGANIKGKLGYFELADRGTIFLDEIGDLSKAMQVKLLHVIQNRAFYRVGGSKEIKVNIRVIVATNRNLEKDVKMGIFREDLFYRINIFPIKLPSLSERIEDIHELVDYLLPKICLKMGTDIKGLSAEALDKMRMYQWPGNIRELENVLERAINLCDGKNILSGHIKIKITKKNFFNQDVYLKPLKDTLQHFELEIIKNVLTHTNGDKNKAMSILGIKKTKLYESIKLADERQIL
ncbi:MAG: sigma 54-interacting transcriptional regulator [Clostridiales bacterium]|nr:sigma 54-interacting transcriptional regulator [Clostridiales bacterium]